MKQEKPALSKNTVFIKGKYHPYKNWVIDKKGYFLIRLDKKKKQIELGFCRKDNIIEKVITGKTPQEVYFTAIKEKLVSRLDHAAYLGKELEKAYLALQNNLEYIQDEELELKKIK